MLGDLRTPEKPWIEYFVFFLKPTGPLAALEKPKLVGMIGVVRLDPRQEMHGLGDGFDNAIGYRVHPDYWGKGIGTEALKGFLELYWTLDGMQISFKFIMRAFFEMY
jgi:RimJ/RimL family protein N-acetyltransferase